MNANNNFAGGGAGALAFICICFGLVFAVVVIIYVFFCLTPSINKSAPRPKFSPITKRLLPLMTTPRIAGGPVGAPAAEAVMLVA